MSILIEITLDQEYAITRQALIQYYDFIKDEDEAILPHLWEVIKEFSAPHEWEEFTQKYLPL